MTEDEETKRLFRRITEANEHRKIVRGDIMRRHKIWIDKGIENRAVLEGMFAAMINGMWVYDEHPRDWLRFLDHVIDTATAEQSRIEQILKESQRTSNE